jgi:hypothetical protein
VIGSNVTGAASAAGKDGGGGLKLGSTLLQKIQNATVWSHRANTQDIFTDCNQRDERLGTRKRSLKAIYEYKRSF